MKVRWPAAGTRLHRARCVMLLDCLLLMAAGSHHQHPPDLPQTTCSSHCCDPPAVIAASTACVWAQLAAGVVGTAASFLI